MGKTRGWMLGLSAVIAVALTGCTHLVHQEDIEGMMDPVNAQLGDHEGRITTLESDVAGLRNDVNELRRRLDQLANDFGAHVSDEDLHCPCGLAISLPVHFDFNRDEIRDVDRPILDAFAAAVMGAYPDGIITVEGFADQAGTEAYNIGLSRRRATNVKSYLVEQGIPADNIRVQPFGEQRQRLLTQETGLVNPQSGIENRRVTFVFEWAGPGSSN